VFASASALHFGQAVRSRSPMNSGRGMRNSFSQNGQRTVTRSAYLLSFILLGGLGVGVGSVELDSLFGFMRGPQSFNELLCLFVYVSDVPATVSAELGQQFLQLICHRLAAFPRY
jgi:hypothetical protein